MLRQKYLFVARESGKGRQSSKRIGDGEAKERGSRGVSKKGTGHARLTDRSLSRPATSSPSPPTRRTPSLGPLSRSTWTT